MRDNDFNLDKLVRANIRELKPYHSARQDFGEGLLLDANENSFGAPHDSMEGLHRYPRPRHEVLRDKIAQFRNVQRENVFVGNGSDEAIDLLFRIFCRPKKDNVLICPPTYGMYGVSAEIHDVQVNQILLDESFQPGVDTILNQADEKTKLLFLCSPNNPTGNNLDIQKVEKLIAKFQGIVVIDEAYIDFSEQRSWVTTICQHPNLVVLQTMSKSFGLAGIRLGTAFASKKIINYMMKVKAPYNINTLTAKTARRALDYLPEIQKSINKITAERTWLQDKLRQLPAVQHIYASDTNFLLVKIDAVEQIYEKLTERAVIVRYRGDEPRCENCLRITVGTRYENDQLLNALKELSL